MSIDLPSGNRPGSPMEAPPEHDAGAGWTTPTRQPLRDEHLTRQSLDDVTPVFGNTQHPRLASGVLRRAAYRLPEHEAKRWLLLMAADRLDVMEHRIPELFTRRSMQALERQVRANPIGMIAAAVGVGYLLHRSGLARAVAGGVASVLVSAPHADHQRTPEEQRLLAWLNDAHALEKAQIPILKNHADDARRHPHVREKDLEHLKQTRAHAKIVRQCIESLGEKPSRSKKAIGRLAGAMNSVATEPFDDEVMRNFLADYAAENLEIVSYRALILAADHAGHPDIARACEHILQDEEDMAAWLEQNLPYAVHETLNEIAGSE